MWPALCTVQYTQGGAAEHSWKKPVGRGDVEMHGKEINSEKNREENVKNKKGTVEASVQQLKHIFHARPCRLTSHNWIILGSWLLTSLAMAGSITAGASRASLDTPLTDSVKIVWWELSVFKFSLSPPRFFLPEWKCQLLIWEGQGKNSWHRAGTFQGLFVVF